MKALKLAAGIFDYDSFNKTYNQMKQNTKVESKIGFKQFLKENKPADVHLVDLNFDEILSTISSADPSPENCQIIMENIDSIRTYHQSLSKYVQALERQLELLSYSLLWEEKKSAAFYKKLEQLQALEKSRLSSVGQV